MEEVFTRLGIEHPGTIVTSWVFILVMGLLAWLATRNLKDVPGPLQALAEMIVARLQGYFNGLLGEKLCKKYFPLFATFFIFIIVSNYSGLLPGAGRYEFFHVPTASLSVTAALAIVAFLATHTIGVREVGAKHYITSFIKPFILFLPLNLIEQIVRPLSLSLRLYGNLFGEETVVENLYEMFPIGLPVLMMVLSLIFCYIQAVVFTMLLSIYVTEACEAEEE